MPKKSNKSSKGNRQIKVDMEGVSSRTLIPEGDYLVTCTENEQGISESSGKPKISWTFEIADGPNKGGKLWYNTSLQPQALFNLKNLLISMGVTVPDSAMKLDLDELIGKQVGVTVTHEMWDSKKRAKISDIFPVDNIEGVDEDEEDEEDEDEDEDTEDTDEDEDEDEEEEDLDEMDLDELLDYAKSKGLKVPSKIRSSETKVRNFIEEQLA